MVSCTCCALELVAAADVLGCRTVGSPAAGQLGGTDGPAAAAAPSAADATAPAAAAPAAADATVGGAAVELELDWS